MLETVRVTELENGCRVATSNIATTESLSIGFFAKVGTRYERPEVLGHSHFLEHMLFKGSAKRSARAISQDIEAHGGNTNAYTNYETTVFYAVTPYEVMDVALDVLGDFYCSPKLLASDVDKERGVILEELNMYHDQPDEYVTDQLRMGLWADHPLGRQILGTEASLLATTAESLRAYHQAYYHAGRTVIVAAGRVEHEAFVEKVRPYAMRLPPKREDGYEIATPDTPRQALLVDARETEQVNAAIGFRVFGRYDKRRQALVLLNTILGGNMSSRLFQEMRERHGFAYSVYSFLGMHDETGSLQIAAGLDRRRSVKAMSVCGKMLAKLAHVPISKSEFERARQYAMGTFRLGLEGSRSQMSWVGGGLIFEPYHSPAEALAEIAAVKLEDVQAVAAEYFRPENVSLSLVMPREDQATAEAHLAALCEGLRSSGR